MCQGFQNQGKSSLWKLRQNTAKSRQNSRIPGINGRIQTYFHNVKKWKVEISTFFEVAEKSSWLPGGGEPRLGRSPDGPKLHTNPIHKTYTIHTEKVYPDMYNSACFCSIIIVNCRHAVSAFCICLMLAWHWSETGPGTVRVWHRLTQW